METRYDFKKIDEKIYKKWLPHLKIKARQAKKEIVFLMAPPNITGSLHLGHSLENTLIDVLARYCRMKGQKPVWLPGIDHAGIATQNVVEKELRRKGISRFALGREKFVKEAWKWKEKYSGIILEQLKKLGITPDWSRVRFTLDKKYIEQVEKAFVEYYKNGLIYRVFRPINWCVRCQSSLSDLEIEWKPQKSRLYYIKYPIKSQKPKAKSQKFIVVATTRPETMLADTAVAVNPNDKRYKNLIGQIAILPIVEREIPIVADDRVDPNFGTGAVKITPAHSLIDYEISQRHNLPLVSVIDENGKILEVKEFEGLNCLAACEKIIEKLTQKNLIEKIDDYDNEIPYCDRCKTEIQVIPSLQWFVKMDKLTKIAVNAVKLKNTLIIPFRYQRTYFDWLKNARDWCISRNLWWGQVLPVWFCQNQTGRTSNHKSLNTNYQTNFVVATIQPPKCPFCRKCKMKRTDEVFDTWFSSALWPFAIHYIAEEKKWYPAHIMSSARDILHLWVTRMIFSGVYFKNKAPFEIAFIHPTIQTKEGKRMSKSLGTGIDPLDLIERYSADALRFGLIWQITNNQDIKFDEAVVVAGKKFATKIWNATRFALMNPKFQIPNPKSQTNPKFKIKNSKKLSAADKKIIKDYNETFTFVEKKILQFEFSDALKKLYNFFWHDFCDVYLEKSKGETINNPEILKAVLENSLKTINIFMPFLTEALWLNLGHKNLLLLEKWPKPL